MSLNVLFLQIIYLLNYLKYEISVCNMFKLDTWCLAGPLFAPLNLSVFLCSVLLVKKTLNQEDWLSAATHITLMISCNPTYIMQRIHPPPLCQQHPLNCHRGPDIIQLLTNPKPNVKVPSLFATLATQCRRKKYQTENICKTLMCWPATNIFLPCQIL